MQPSDYPNPARSIEYDEMMQYTDALMMKIAEYNPDEIVGVARSGLPFATFIAQKLDLDVGYFNPKFGHFQMAVPSRKRVVFVDENFVSGRTQSQIRDFMAANHPNIEYKLACVMLDSFCPDQDCMYGVFLDFWATNMACFFKPVAIENRGVRFRDDRV